MTTLPGATTRPAAAAVIRALERAGVVDVDGSSLTRSLYSSDASLYRVEPLAVVRPRSSEEIAATLDACRLADVSVTMRGTGTSIAGNAVGPGVVIDTSRHLNRILELDVEQGTALVEPGVIHASLQRAAVPKGWRFGPDPSTHTRATIGGMIGNNACGSRALGYGRTSDNVLGLDVITAGDSSRTAFGLIEGADATANGPLVRALRGLVSANLATIRTELGRFGRQVSGYGLEHLLPERGFDVAKALVGSEGTLAITAAARVRLVKEPAARLLVMLGYASMVDAADDVPAVLPHSPVACEGLDARIIDAVRALRGPTAVPPLPTGSGWLMIELAGDSMAELRARATRVVADTHALDAAVIDSAGRAAALWRIREDGAGLASRTANGRPAYSGWEDAAVPPEHLGAYLRDFERLVADAGLSGVPYGHFGDGCVHVRLDFPLDRADGPRVFRHFMESAADLVATYGGSMSGEHGDGRARSGLLARMYSVEALALFSDVKSVFDPGDILNPGIIVRPEAVDEHLRAAPTPLRAGTYQFAFTADSGDLAIAAHRCTGVGKCRADNGTGEVMCPSFIATRDEKDSTRGRARVLQDALSGRLGPDGLRGPEVAAALDLCLACKGCSHDCPTGVDMATYKAEALDARYRGRLRPRSHYALGRLPTWLRLASATSTGARLANAVAHSRWTAPFMMRAAGADPRRTLPRMATTPLRRMARVPTGAAPGKTRPRALLLVDCFTDTLDPQVGLAAVQVLESAGYEVAMTGLDVCCSVTWISTGQLAAARRRLRVSINSLADAIAEGAIVVGLEPSCTGVLRSDALELLDGEDRVRARAVSDATRTLAEALAVAPSWKTPDLTGVELVAQPHCHQHAIMGWDEDERLLTDAGATVQRIGGCCGLAGNFGLERGHHELSLAVADQQLIPALDAAGPTATVLADGVSCRTQVGFVRDRSAVHLAQLLAERLAARSIT